MMEHSQISDPNLDLFNTSILPDSLDLDASTSQNDVTQIGDDHFLDEWLTQFVNGITPGLLNL